MFEESYSIGYDGEIFFVHKSQGWTRPTFYTSHIQTKNRNDRNVQRMEMRVQIVDLSRRCLLKGELNPKIKFVLFERTLKITG